MWNRKLILWEGRQKERRGRIERRRGEEKKVEHRGKSWDAILNEYSDYWRRLRTPSYWNICTCHCLTKQPRLHRTHVQKVPSYSRRGPPLSSVATTNETRGKGWWRSLSKLVLWQDDLGLLYIKLKKKPVKWLHDWHLCISRNIKSSHGLLQSFKNGCGSTLKCILWEAGQGGPCL